MAKSTSETSKKMLLLHFTLARAEGATRLGMVRLCVPSLGVAARSVSGNVRPPLVESMMSTLGQFTGGEAVFATFHVTVCNEPPGHVPAAFGAVTWNGPAAVLTLNDR